MENVTITIKQILESYSFPNVLPHDKPWNDMSVDQIIDNGKAGFFDFPFPWYAEDKTGLDEFEELFLRKFYMRQIGCETTALFKMYMQTVFMEKIPLYKQLYETTLLEYNPLVNRKVSVTTNRKEEEGRDKTYQNEDVTTGSSSQESSGSGSVDVTSSANQTVNTQGVHSENPEITVANNDYASSMDRGKTEDDRSGTESTDSTSSNSTENTVNQNVKSDSTENESVNRDVDETVITEGFYGDSQADAVLKVRETFLNLNEMLCRDMEKLFLDWYGGVDYVW